MSALRARTRAARVGGWALCAALAAAAGASRADLPVEVKGGTRLPPATPHRLYVMDAAFNHLVDSRVNLYDGDSLKFLGLVPTSFNGHMTVSNDGKDIYVMTSYYERLNRGKRIDVVEAWDAEALTPKYEVAIPEARPGPELPQLPAPEHRRRPAVRAERHAGHLGDGGGPEDAQVHR